MTRLASMAEMDKLARLLGVSAEQIAPEMYQLPAVQVREIRRAVSERLFRLDEHVFRRLARIANLLPTWAVLWLAQRRFGPLISARIAGLMTARKAARAAGRMPANFLADVSLELDPRYARDILAQLSATQIVAIVQVLIARGEYMTMGRFVDYLADDTIRAVLNAVPDEEHLVRIAYYMESKNRIDHVVRMMPIERLRRAILMILEPERDLLLPLMSLVFHVSYGLQQELGELAAEQDEQVLNEIATATQSHQLWGDLLPVVALLSQVSQGKVVNLPILRDDPAVLESVLQSADRDGRWRDVLPLIPYMEVPMLEAAAVHAAALPDEAIRRIADACLLGELWEEVVIVLSRMPKARLLEIASILKLYDSVDPALWLRIIGIAEAKGMGEVFRAA